MVRRRRERGSAMLVTLIGISALLAGGAVLLTIQLTSARGAEVTTASLSGLHCAEAGVVAARATVETNHASWAGWIGTGTEPAWLGAVNHDLDGDGQPDFTITLRDNDDEDPNDPLTDADQTIYIVSTCIAHPELRTQVAELVHWSGSTLERRLWIRLE